MADLEIDTNCLNNQGKNRIIIIINALEHLVFVLRVSISADNNRGYEIEGGGKQPRD